MGEDIVQVTFPDQQLQTAAQPGANIQGFRYGNFRYDEACILYLKNTDKKEQTARIYANVLGNLKKWCRSNSLDENRLFFENIKQFKEDMIAQGKSDYTVNLYITVIRNFYHFLSVSGLYPDIAAFIKNVPTVKEHRKNPLTIAQARRILEHTRARSLRNYTILKLCLTTGLRTVEICRLNVENLCMEGDTHVIMVKGKGRNSADQKVPLIDETYALMKEYRDTKRIGAGMKEPFFVGEGHRQSGKRLTPRAVQAMITKTYGECGLDDHKITPHSLRHTFANLLISEGCNAYDVKTCLRHENIETSERYMADATEKSYLENPPQRHLEGLLG